MFTNIYAKNCNSLPYVKWMNYFKMIKICGKMRAGWVRPIRETCSRDPVYFIVIEFWNYGEYCFFIVTERTRNKEKRKKTLALCTSESKPNFAPMQWLIYTVLSFGLSIYLFINLSYSYNESLWFVLISSRKPLIPVAHDRTSFGSSTRFPYKCTNFRILLWSARTLRSMQHTYEYKRFSLASCAGIPSSRAASQAHQ